MSHRDFILTTFMDEQEAMTRLNAWCKATTDEEFVQLATEKAGGWKVLTTDVWAMASKQLPAVGLRERLPTFGWDSPEHVRLQVYDGEETIVYAVHLVGRRVSIDELRVPTVRAIQPKERP
jgi:hypothetical protein